MNNIVIAIGTDHRGFALKEQLIKMSSIGQFHIIWIDVGTKSPERTDYPPFAQAVVEEIKSGRARFGILLCGTGHGMAIAANRTEGIYAAVVWNESIARAAKEDDNCNIVVFPADLITVDQSVGCILAWLNASFKAGRYAQRLAMIDV